MDYLLFAPNAVEKFSGAQAAGRADENLASCQKSSPADRAIHVRRMGRLPVLVVWRGLRFVHRFFLLNRRTRPVAYVFVLIFHGATALFFPAIGMFPYVMILSSLIFFSGESHTKLLSFLRLKKNSLTKKAYEFKYQKAVVVFAALYVTFQLLFPLRFLILSRKTILDGARLPFFVARDAHGKAGAAYFTVKDRTGQKSYMVDNKQYLNLLQEKMMSTQPDLILQYAHYLANTFKAKGLSEPKVYAEVYVTLNGSPSRLFTENQSTS